MNLKGRTIGIIAGPGFADSQVVKVAQRLRQRGARVSVIGTGESEAVAVAGRQGSLLKPDIVLSKARAGLFDALIITGGDSMERLVADERILTLLLETHLLHKPIGASCNATPILAAAGLITGMRVTGDARDRDELEKAGSIYLDQGVTVDHNIVTARAEEDVPHFVDAVSFLLEPATSRR